MQGFNMGRYHPPDPSDQPPARKRPKPNPGVQTVRFECPFPIWCTSCHPDQIIGQGVRFNAEKKKVGNYYSTPIWEFRLKHTLCGGTLVVRTDPQAGEYIVVEGGRRRVNALPEEGEIGVTVLGREAEAAKERLEADGGGFGMLEKKVLDKRRLLSEKDRLEELQARNERDWSDPYAMNSRVRREFRVGRQLRKEHALKSIALQDKLSLNITLLDETEEDGRRARLVDFAHEDRPVKPMFPPLGKRVDAAASKKVKLKLQSRVAENTKASLDPFLQQQQQQQQDDGGGEGGWQPRRTKRKDVDVVSNQAGQAALEEVSGQRKALVGYDTDSDSSGTMD